MVKKIKNFGEKELTEILKKDFLNPPYLDNFSLNSNVLPKVSAIIPTFNRCPHSVEDDSNPLAWCLESLLSQKSSSLDEIIIINDASTDYTEEVVKDFQQKSYISIIHLKNPKNLGSSISRNIGVNKSKNELIIFLDDDCIFSKYMVFGATYTLNKLEKLSEEVAALHLPIYHRKTMPNLVDLKEIGILDFKKGIMTGNYGGFPKQFAENLEDNLLNKKLGVLKPLEIKNLGGIFLAKKKHFQEIGGFPEFFSWTNGYREETYVASKFSDKGYKMFFTPDPKFYCIHLKYGANDSNQNINTEDFHLKRLINESNSNKINTGNRVDQEEWFFNYIISTYVMLGKKNIKVARTYLNKIKKDFIDNNNLSITGIETKIEDIFIRQKIFESAIYQGNKLIGASV